MPLSCESLHRYVVRHPWVPVKRRAAGLALLGTLAALPAGADTYDFVVLCNGNPVGHHTVHVREHDGQTDVDTNIAVSVSLAGLQLYRYRHVGSEHWENGRLISLESITDDDGERMHLVVRRADDDRLVIEGSDGVKTVSGDFLPASYWNPAILTRREVIDNQSGKLLQVSVKPLGEGRFGVSGDVNFEVDYREGRWSGLRFSYDGAEVAYQKQQQVSVSAP